MLDQGKVIETKENLAQVEFASASACAECGACHKASSGRMVTEARNEIWARVGDRVEVEVSPAVFTLFPFVAYIVPLLFFFLGIVLGSLFSATMGLIWGFVLLAVGFVVARWLGQYISGQNHFICRIVRVLS
jgi:sigma-E factor negative regulatory protein RseC